MVDAEISGIIDLTHEDEYALCNDERFKGLDKHAAKTWIYPTNLPFRQYQYDIAETALSHNTLVSLPTGLGKTMIAVVVMYNMYRWYPAGRIVFMAPTRPLVAQQADACQKITCIPAEHMAQLTGDVQSSSRGLIWEKLRLVFLTPQILQRDLQSKICPAHLIRCIVFDEAHRARGNHAYCEVMRLLGDHASRIRVLALSATPGSTSSQVAEVICSLRIARLEIRTESSEDVKPYVFSKSLETIIVELGEPLSSIKEQYIKILDGYTRRLMQSGVLTGVAGNIHKGRIFMVQKEYKASCQRKGKKPDSFILQDLSFCLTLYHAYEVLIKHGLRGFLSFYDDNGRDKTWVRKDNRLCTLLDQIRHYLGDSQLNLDMLPDGTIPEVPNDFIFGHPKYVKLREIISHHFTAEPDTRVMIFCEYKDSVYEAFGALLQCRPYVRPRMFLGQAAISQKQQLSVMKNFRDGNCNTLICTCVAEEGLDVAAVQLIVCFDIANRSPVRLAQRMGRTGRHQLGRIVMLVTEGREQQTLAETLQQSNLLDTRLLKSPEIQASLLAEGPPVLPDGIEVTCHRLHIASTISGIEKTRQAKKRDMLSIKSKKESTNWNGPPPEDTHVNISSKTNFWTLKADDYRNLCYVKGESVLRYKNRENNVHCEITPSKETQLLNSLFKKCEELRFNLPFRTSSQTCSVKTKNQDIRNMFGGGSQSQNDFDVKSPVKQPILVTQTSSKSGFKNTTFLINLRSELSTRNSLNLLLDKKCVVCENWFNCRTITQAMKIAEVSIPTWTEPDMSVLDSVTYENLKNLNVEDVSSTSPGKLKHSQSFDFESYNRERLFEKLKREYEVQHCSMNVDYLNGSFQPVITLSSNESTEQNNFENESIVQNCFENEFNTKVKNRADLSMFSNNLLDAEFVENNFTNKNFAMFNAPDTNGKNYTESSQLSCKSRTVEKCKRNPNLDISEYFHDDISRDTLKFFRLASIEDLFLEHKPEIIKGNSLKNQLFDKYLGEKELSSYPSKNLKRDIEVKVKSPGVSHRLPQQNCLMASNKYAGLDSFDDSVVDFVLQDTIVSEDTSDDGDDILSFDLAASKTQFVPITASSESNVSRNLNREKEMSPILSSQRFNIANQSRNASFNNGNKSETDSKKIEIGKIHDTNTSIVSSSVPDSEDSMSPILSSQTIKQTHINKRETLPLTNFGLDPLRKEKPSSLVISSQNRLSPKLSRKTQTSQQLLEARLVAQDNSLVSSSPNNRVYKMVESESVGEKRTRVDILSDDDMFAEDSLLNGALINCDQNLSTTHHKSQKISREITTGDVPNDGLTPKETLACINRSPFENASMKTKLQLKRINSCEKTRVDASKPLHNRNLSCRQIFSNTNQGGASEEICKRYNFDSDDESLCNFIAPVKKRYMKEMKKQSFDSTLEVDFEAHTSKSQRSVATANTSMDFLAQFTFQKNVKKLGDSNRQVREADSPIKSYSFSKKLNGHVKKKRRIKSTFIEYEADASDDDSDPGNSSEDEDELDDSFVVNNDVLSQGTNVDMHAHYLQSIRSPKKSLNAFKIPQLAKIKMDQICSQADWNEDNTYINDSFCVDNTVVNTELSVLEIAEMKLARKKRKRKLTNSTGQRIRAPSDSSEEDDMANFRDYCLNNLSNVH